MAGQKGTATSKSRASELATRRADWLLLFWRGRFTDTAVDNCFQVLIVIFRLVTPLSGRSLTRRAAAKTVVVDRLSPSCMSACCRWDNRGQRSVLFISLGTLEFRTPQLIYVVSGRTVREGMNSRGLVCYARCSRRGPGVQLRSFGVAGRNGACGGHLMPRWQTI